MTPEYVDYKNRIQEQQAAVARTQELVDREKQLLKDLLEECPHEETEHKSSYYPGSYYDKAYTDHWNECKLCGAKSEVTTETHSYYG